MEKSKFLEKYTLNNKVEVPNRLYLVLIQMEQLATLKENFSKKEEQGLAFIF